MWCYLNLIPCLDVKSGPTRHLLDFWIDLPSKDPQHVFLLCISCSFLGLTSIVILGFERMWSHTRASDIYVKLGLMFVLKVLCLLLSMRGRSFGGGSGPRTLGCTVIPLTRWDFPFPDKVSSILSMLSQTRYVKTCGLMETGSEIYYLLWNNSVNDINDFI